MTNINITDRKALNDDVRFITAREINVASGETLNILVELPSDSEFDLYVENAAAYTSAAGSFCIHDNVDYTGGNDIQVSTSAIDGVTATNEFTAKKNVTVNSSDVRFNAEIGGGSGTGGGATSGTANFATARITHGHNFMVQVTNEDGNGQRLSANIRMYMVRTENGN